MKNVLTKITAVLMTFVVLFSTMSFTISSHYCGDYLVGVSYFGKAKSCGMEMTSNNSLEECSITKKNCCKDTVDLIKGQDVLKKTSFDSLALEQQLFIASFYYSYYNLFSALNNKVTPFKYYSPPLIVKDIQVLHEVYLI
ncbi:HYC_CC_PP family protein [Tenacibaculum sp. MEBiC06402]|uniref:HYC_CC_PP family protein n=1 Tax=unclassified Tenacibaculum TaxID=2635139 RepID=UPI003B99D994